MILALGKQIIHACFVFGRLCTFVFQMSFFYVFFYEGEEIISLYILTHLSGMKTQQYDTLPLAYFPCHAYSCTSILNCCTFSATLCSLRILRILNTKSAQVFFTLEPLDIHLSIVFMHQYFLYMFHISLTTYSVFYSCYIFVLAFRIQHTYPPSHIHFDFQEYFIIN